MAIGRDELSDYAARTIRHKARQLVGRAGFTDDDVDDIEQDLWIDLIERLPKFDPQRATHATFVARVIDHKISRLIRHRTAGPRDYRRVECSLNDTITDTDGEEVQRVHTMDQDETDARMGRRRRSMQDEVELQIDLSMVLSHLPESDREIAECLMRQSITEAAKGLGIARSSVYEAMAKMRRHFDDAGLRAYLE